MLQQNRIETSEEENKYASDSSVTSATSAGEDEEEKEEEEEAEEEDSGEEEEEKKEGKEQGKVKHAPHHLQHVTLEEEQEEEKTLSTKRSALIIPKNRGFNLNNVKAQTHTGVGKSFHRSRSSLGGGRNSLLHKSFKTTAVTTKNRINQMPFRSLSLIIEVIALLEILAIDPQIKRYIHDLTTFANAPNRIVFGEHDPANGVVSKIPISFYTFGLLLHAPMSFMLVPSSSSVTGKAAAAVPLYHSIAKALTVMCRFDQRNKIAISSAVLPFVIQIFLHTKSRSLIMVRLGWFCCVVR